MNRLFGTWIAVALGGLLSGCTGYPKLDADYIGIGELALAGETATGGTDATSLPQLSPETGRPTYRVGSGDFLIVAVWGRPDFGSQIAANGASSTPSSQVDPEGNIFLPFLGKVQVANLTVSEIAELVTRRYLGIVEEAQVEVRLVGCHSRTVYLEGAVATPGIAVLCDDRLTLGEVLSASGGLAPEADLARGLLVREGVPFALDYRGGRPGEPSASEVLLEPGDRIYFPSSEERSAYVFGEVRRQGAFPLPVYGMSLLDLLARAGGYDVTTARTESLFLVRLEDRGPVVYQFRLAQALDGPDIPLRDGDRLLVPPTGLARWDRWWSQFLFFRTGTSVAVTPLI